MKHRPMPNEVIFEFIHRGAYVKVSAIDPATGIEASIVGDAQASEAQLQQLAAQKLAYVVRKHAEE